MEQAAVSNLPAAAFSGIGGIKPSDLPIAKIEETIDDIIDLRHTKPVIQEYQPVSLSVENGDILLEKASEAGDDTTKLDTVEISVFDIFGLPRPSQTHQIQPVSDDDLAESVETNTGAAIAPSTTPTGRIGLRLQNRRKRLNLCTP